MFFFRWWTQCYQTMMQKVPGLILLMNLLNTWMRMASSRKVIWTIGARRAEDCWRSCMLCSVFQFYPVIVSFLHVRYGIRKRDPPLYLDFISPPTGCWYSYSFIRFSIVTKPNQTELSIFTTSLLLSKVFLLSCAQLVYQPIYYREYLRVENFLRVNGGRYIWTWWFN